MSFAVNDWVRCKENSHIGKVIQFKYSENEAEAVIRLFPETHAMVPISMLEKVMVLTDSEYSDVMEALEEALKIIEAQKIKVQQHG